ncbi:MAG: hypothetical protein IPF55_10585 [Rhodoferax sp.]|nr:hypothetical protein [Rhodoferax sp.]
MTAVTRPVDVRAIDAAWFDHHFTWARDTNGAEKLVQRTGAPPYPRLGRIVNFGSVMADYRLDEATPALQQALLAFLVERFNAKVQPSRTADVPDTPGTLIWLRMGAREYKLRYEPKDKQLLLSFPSVRLNEEGRLRPLEGSGASLQRRTGCGPPPGLVRRRPDEIARMGCFAGALNDLLINGKGDVHEMGPYIEVALSMCTHSKCDEV